MIRVNLLSEGLNLSRAINPVELYDSLQFGKYPALSSELDRQFEVIAYPGERLEQPIQEGDVVVRRALSEPLGYIAVVAEANLWSNEEIATTGSIPESDRPGFYAHIIDEGSSSHEYANVARLIVDRHQRVPNYQILLRPKSSFIPELNENLAEEADPCIDGYTRLGTKEREIHLNLGLRAIRIFFRTASGFRHEEFSPIITGDVTRDLARATGWCHMHPIVVKLDGPTSHGLINFAVFCLKREIGFHSDRYIVNGSKVRIPGNVSAGCARVPDTQSRRFFNEIGRNSPTCSWQVAIHLARL